MKFILLFFFLMTILLTLALTLPLFTHSLSLFPVCLTLPLPCPSTPIHFPFPCTFPCSSCSRSPSNFSPLPTPSLPLDPSCPLQQYYYCTKIILGIVASIDTRRRQQLIAFCLYIYDSLEWLRFSSRQLKKML